MIDLSKDELSKLVSCGEFDVRWYLETFPDVALSGMDPAEHFQRIGRRIGRRGAPAGVQAGCSQVVDEPAEVTAEGRVRSRPDDAILAKAYAEIDRYLDADTRRRIADFGLFDEGWYRETYGDAIFSPDDCLKDYLAARIHDDGRDPSALFSTSYYETENPDTVGMHPLIHFIDHGIREGRRAISPSKANKFLSQFNPRALTSIFNLIDKRRPTLVLYWERGNFFFQDIAEYTARYLEELGFVATSLPDAGESELLASNIVVIAPHEFCVHGPGKNWSSVLQERTVALNTEQWHTSWFVLSLQVMKRSRIGALDINPSSAAGLTELGIHTGFIPLLPLAGSCFDYPSMPISGKIQRRKYIKSLTYPINYFDRPYDVCFLGTLNERRGKALASLGKVLSRFDCFIHCPTFNGPIMAGDADMMSGSDFAQIAKNSKLLLNIHQGESQYLEWHRIFVSGIMEGCVVVTEPSIPIGVIEPGVHYLVSPLEQMPEFLKYLLADPDGRETLNRVHQNCLQMRTDIMNGERLAF